MGVWGEKNMPHLFAKHRTPGRRLRGGKKWGRNEFCRRPIRLDRSRGPTSPLFSLLWGTTYMICTGNQSDARIRCLAKRCGTPNATTRIFAVFAPNPAARTARDRSEPKPTRTPRVRESTRRRPAAGGYPVGCVRRGERPKVGNPRKKTRFSWVSRRPALMRSV